MNIKSCTTALIAAGAMALLSNAAFAKNSSHGPDHQVAKFDGKDDYIVMGNPFSDVSKGVHLDFWIKPDGTNSHVLTLNGLNPERTNEEFSGTIFSFAIVNETTARFILRETPIHHGGMDIRYKDAIIDKDWNHISLSLYPAKDGNEGSLHFTMNGKSIHPTSVNGNAFTPQDKGDLLVNFPEKMGDSALRLEVGRNTKGTGRYYKGLIDNIRIWNNAIIKTGELDGASVRVKSAYYNFGNVTNSGGVTTIANEVGKAGNPSGTIHGASIYTLPSSEDHIADDADSVELTYKDANGNVIVKNIYYLDYDIARLVFPNGSEQTVPFSSSKDDKELCFKTLNSLCITLDEHLVDVGQSTGWKNTMGMSGKVEVTGLNIK